MQALLSLWTSATKHRGWRQVDHGQFDHIKEITQATAAQLLVSRKAMRDVGLLAMNSSGFMGKT